MLIPYNNIGTVGVVKDVRPDELPAAAWTDARNVRFSKRGVHKAPGLTLKRTASIAPYMLLPGDVDGGISAYLGLEYVYGFDLANQADITQPYAAYDGTENDQWNGGILNGVAIFNNGVNKPQMWSPPTLATALADLSNWPADTYAKVIRPFKNYLVAIDVTKSATRYKRLVKWSHEAAAGAVPSSWDETDPTVDAGEVVLGEGDDALVDMLPLGETNVIYAKLSTWGMRLAGFPFIFNFGNLFRNSGLLAQGCVAEWKKQHFTVTFDDIILHNGESMESVIESRLREWFFNNLSTENFQYTKVVPNYKLREMWVLFPYGDSSTLNMALVWNWAYNTWTIVELPNIKAALSIPFLASTTVVSDNWNSESAQNWDTESAELWTLQAVEEQRSFKGSFLLADVNTKKIFLLDESSYLKDGAAYTSYVQRIGLCHLMSPTGEMYRDIRKKKQLTAIWPFINAPAGTQFQIRGGSHNIPDGRDISWGDYVTFTVGTDEKADVYANGRFLAFEIRETNSVAWDMTHFAVDVEPIGGL